MSLSIDSRRELFQLAWPASLMAVAQSLYRLNDQFFVQELGARAQSAVAVASMVAIGYFAFAQLVAVGNLAIASRRLGEGRTEAAHTTMRSGIGLALAIGLVLAAVTLITLPWLCQGLIRGEDVGQEQALLADYLFWVAAGQVVMVTAICVDSCFLALKDSRIPMCLQFLAITTNIVLNWQFVPVWGVSGAAIASVISRALPMLIGLWLLQRKGMILIGPVSRAIGLRILKIGLPACIAIVIYSAVYQVMLGLTFVHFDEHARSTLGIAFGIESVFFCFYWGIATAVASLVGRHLGSGKADLAIAIAKLATWIGLLVGILTSSLFWIAGPSMVGFFTTDDAVSAANVEYLNILAWAQPMQAMQTMYEQVLIGAGATVPVMISTGITNLARLPLAHLFGVVLGHGLAGIWWAINLTSVAKYIWAWLLFRGGRWQKQKV